MIKRLHVHNFRCLENFELPASSESSILLVGKNGSGKSTIGRALEVLQKIARGRNRVSELLSEKDFAHGRTSIPARFELDVVLNDRTFTYSIAFDLPEDFRELRVVEEKLFSNGEPVFTRKEAQVYQVFFQKTGRKVEAQFMVDRHLAALPIIQEPKQGPLSIFREWLSRMLILRPAPSLILGESRRDTLEPNPEVANFGDWLAGVLASEPSAYILMDEYLKQVMPDFRDLKNQPSGKDAKNLVVSFSAGQGLLSVDFEDLSDGEKCFMICAVTLAANRAYGPLLCFWDEPDNYLAPDEVGHFVIALRKAFQSHGQFIATSHNPEAISRFSYDSTYVLSRRSHLEPVSLRPATSFDTSGDFVGALTRGDLSA